MKFLKANWITLVTIVLFLAIGILLLVNPEFFSMLIVRVIGGLLVVLGGVYIFRYFREKPEEAAQSQLFFNGAVALAIGFFCLLASGWLLRAFPILAVIFGLLQILLGFYMVQKTVDDVRLKQPLWYLKAISAGICLVFGFIIVMNADMAFMDIWVFTAIGLILEGIFDIFALIFAWKKNGAAPAAHVTIPEAAPKAVPESTAEAPAPAAPAPAEKPAAPADSAPEAPVASWAAPAKETPEAASPNQPSPEA